MIRGARGEFRGRAGGSGACDRLGRFGAETGDAAVRVRHPRRRQGRRQGYNPLIPGDDDAVITVESTRLAGARDFRVLPVLHTFFMDDKRAQELTLRFLNHGHFESDEKRQPIEA